jgi:hypothetical protein
MDGSMITLIDLTTQFTNPKFCRYYNRVLLAPQQLILDIGYWTATLSSVTVTGTSPVTPHTSYSYSY